MALTFGLWDSRGVGRDSIRARLDRRGAGRHVACSRSESPLWVGRGRAYGRDAGSLALGGDDAGARLHAAAIAMSGPRLLSVSLIRLRRAARGARLAPSASKEG